jgi:hypothetical protein
MERSGFFSLVDFPAPHKGFAQFCFIAFRIKKEHDAGCLRPYKEQTTDFSTLGFCAKNAFGGARL